MSGSPTAAMPSRYESTPSASRVKARSNTVTIALKVGSFSTFDASGYHDELSVTAIPPPLPTPSLTTMPLIALVVLVVFAGIGFSRRNASRT